MRRYCEIVRASEQIVRGAIRKFWRMPADETPTARELLSTAVLTMVILDFENGHELHLHDQADLVASHDLVIVFDARYRPVSARFDG
ncbi:MAG: hypothetical protein IT431_04900 [Phycisphaerales bacterium]|nr:hypothetical protein [Phycisphaerales bacterium]